MKSNDETNELLIRYDSNGLIAAIAQDVTSGEILMMAWMNDMALRKTIETGEAHYWSRSRGELWHKGATSGSIQYIEDIRVDCDQDCVLLLVRQSQGACHTGRRSCFYRRISDQGDTLTFIEAE